MYILSDIILQLKTMQKILFFLTTWDTKDAIIVIYIIFVLFKFTFKKFSTHVQ